MRCRYRRQWLPGLRGDHTRVVVLQNGVEHVERFRPYLPVELLVPAVAFPDALNSLIADRMAGRQMEIDARNGAVVRFGKKHGIPTPMNEMAVALLIAAQEKH